MYWLKQSTAVTLKIGPFIDDTDGKTAETGLTLAQADVRLSKNGANIAQKNEATSCTHDELGIYGCPLDTTDTGTLGRLQLWVHETGALPVWHEFMVVPANVWDSMFGSDMLKVDVHAIDDDETAANNLEAYCDGTTPIPANATQISADATAADNAEAFFDGTGYAGTNNVIPTVTALTGHTAQTGDNYARLGAPASASIAADLVVIDNFVDDLETRLTAARAGYLDELAAANLPADIDTLLTRITAAVALASVCTEARLAELDAANLPADIDALPTTAEVNAEVDTALADIHLDHFIQVASTVNDAAAAAGDFDTALAEATNDHYNNMIIAFTSGVLAGQARRISDYDGTSKNIIITPAFTEAPANSDPFIIVSGSYLEVVAERLDTQAKADVNAEADIALTDYDPPTNAEMEARTLVAASYFDPGADAVANVTLVATTTANSDMRGTDSAALASICTETRLAELAAANLPADIAALPTTAEVNIEVDTALSDIHLDHLLAVDYDPASKPGVATALFNELIESDGGVSRYTANALEEAPTGGSAPTVGEIADAVWDEDVVAAHNTAGTAGALLDDVGTPADFKATGFSTHSAADAADAVWNEASTGHVDAGKAGQQLWTDLDAILADTNELQTDDIPGAITGLNDPAAATIADAVWDETNTGHVDAGKAGQQLWTDIDAVLADTNELQTDDTPAAIAALNDPTAAAIADAIWDEAKSSHVGAGSFGEEVQSHATPAEVDTECDEALTNYDGPTNAEMEARTLAAASYFDPSVDAVASVTLVATTTANSDMRGTDSAALASVCTEARLAELAAANLPTDLDAVLADTGELQTDLADGGRLDLLVDAIKAKTDNLPADPADDSDIDAQLATIAGYLDTEVAAILADTNELQTDWVDGGRLDLLIDAIKVVTDALPDSGALSDLATILADTNELQTDDVPGLIAALNDVAVTDVTQRQIPDSVPADGTRPTIEQALYMIVQRLHEAEVIDTTMTVKKVDGSTALLTLTLNDATDPTSITRAT